MRPVTTATLVVAFTITAAAQAPDPPLSDTRLTVHTLLREDAFAGFLANDMERFARAERNIDLLLEQRPSERANLLAWKGGTALYRAVVAHEAGKRDDFQRYLQTALNAFDEAAKLPTGNDGVAAVTGGSLSLFADRLPAEDRARAWSRSYDAYSLLWKAQERAVDKLPVHFRGELLGGIAQAAQRTGRTEESAQYVERMLVLLQGTAYESAARQWKSDPAAAATTKLTCKNCHNPGRLTARLEALQQ
jgi:putative intracellular protease/amidase